MRNQTDFRKHRPSEYPPGWRFLVLATEDWVKNKQEWPANIRKREREAQAEKRQKEDQEKDEDQPEREDDEETWRREKGQDTGKHQTTYGIKETNSQQQPNGSKEVILDTPDKDSQKPQSEYQKLREKYSPQEITLLQHLQHENKYMYSLS